MKPDSIWFEEFRRQRLQNSARNPGLAALMSFFVMGLGQVYAGHVDRGIVLLGTYMTGMLSFYSLYTEGLLYQALFPAMGANLIAVLCYFCSVVFFLTWIYNIKDAYYLSLFSSFRDWLEVERVLLPVLKTNNGFLTPGASVNSLLEYDEPEDGKPEDDEPEDDLQDNYEDVILVSDFNTLTFNRYSWKLYVGLFMIFILVGIWLNNNYLSSKTRAEQEAFLALSANLVSELAFDNALIADSPEETVVEIPDPVSLNESVIEVRSPAPLEETVVEVRSPAPLEETVVEVRAPVLPDETVVEVRAPVLPDETVVGVHDTSSPTKMVLVKLDYEQNKHYLQEHFDEVTEPEKHIAAHQVDTKPVVDTVIVQQGQVETKLLERETALSTPDEVQTSGRVLFQTTEAKPVLAVPEEPAFAQAVPASEAELDDILAEAPQETEKLAQVSVMKDVPESTVRSLKIDDVAVFSTSSGISAAEAGIVSNPSDAALKDAVAVEKSASISRKVALTALREKGFFEYSRGNWEEALPHYLEYLKEREDGRIYDVVAIIFEKLNMPRAAFEASEQAYALGVTEFTTTARLGRLAEKVGEFEKGQFFLYQAITMSPHRIDLRILYARCLSQSGKKVEALAELEKVVRGGSKPSYAVTRRLESEIARIQSGMSQ